MVLKGDSGATSHYIKESEATLLASRTSTNGPKVTLPDGLTLQGSEKGHLPLSTKLTSISTTATVMPGMTNASLLSLGQLCDDNCSILLNKKNLYALKDRELILHGKRSTHDKLWDIPLPNQYPMETTVMQDANYSLT